MSCAELNGSGDEGGGVCKDSDGKLAVLVCQLRGTTAIR